MVMLPADYIRLKRKEKERERAEKRAERDKELERRQAEREEELRNIGRQEMLDWITRKAEAEEIGEDFTEPPPGDHIGVAR